MEKTISFKKDIDFENNIYQINSISLEHNLSLKDENTISGNFIISGNYSITESSVDLIDFNYDLPFSISIDKKYDASDVTVDINDFYYEVINNKALSINIEVLVNGLVLKEENINKIDDRESLLDVNEENGNAEVEEATKEFIDSSEAISSIFDNVDEGENYVTYKVHIVSENDTVETIIKKYEVASSKLDLYNNLADLKIGDKVIIPTND